GLSLTDDGVSCDHDGYLDPGESGVLHVTVANNGILDAEAVTIAATSSNAGIKLGAPLHMAALKPFTSAQLTIPVTVLPSAPRNTRVTINIHVAGQNTCDRNGVDASLVMLTGADDIANASNIDHAETKISPWTATGSGAASVWGRAIEASGNQSFFGKNAGFSSDTQFVSPPLEVRTTEPFVVKLQHAYSLEGAPGGFFDGGVIELSSDGGATWSDVSALGVDPGYTGTLVVGTGNPIGGRPAFTGTSPGFPARSLLTLDFGTRFAGQTVQLRFRIGTDSAVSASGWDIDDVEVGGITNTPFPILVSESTVCTGRRSAEGADEISVVAMQAAPAASLASVDAAVCIANDTP
ncbi:MAG TPA: hypothetical protein VFT22_01975, partial [Kofleriaceae bacterium]|nr:hypothetical protein [Kofleriaceae bacterium]